MSEGGSALTIRIMDLSYRCIVGSYCALLGLFLINSLTALDQFSLAIPVIWLLQSAPLLGFARLSVAKMLSSSFGLAWLCYCILRMEF